MGSVVDIIAYGAMVALYGVILSYMGINSYKYVMIPLIMLLFMIPLPGFLYQSLSNELQLISSKIGVGLAKRCQEPFFGHRFLVGGDLGSKKVPDTFSSPPLQTVI